MAMMEGESKSRERMRSPLKRRDHRRRWGIAAARSEVAPTVIVCSAIVILFDPLNLTVGCQPLPIITYLGINSKSQFLVKTRQPSTGCLVKYRFVERLLADACVDTSFLQSGLRTRDIALIRKERDRGLYRVHPTRNGGCAVRHAWHNRIRCPILDR